MLKLNMLKHQDIFAQYVESSVRPKMLWNCTSLSTIAIREIFYFHEMGLLLFVANLGRAPAEGYHFQEPSELLQFLRKDKLDLKYYCTICENFSHKLSSCTRNHVESQHFPNHFTYTCDICEMNFGTKTTLNLHRSRKHKTRSYNFHC